MITLLPQSGQPLLCAKHSTEPVDGRFPADDEILAWAYVFKHILGRCPHCGGHELHPSAILNTRKNGDKWWTCKGCGKNVTMRQIQEAKCIVFDLAWIQTADKHQGQGHARDILEHLKTKCHRLHTQISASSEHGKTACMAAGMVERGHTLSWVREGYEMKESNVK
jgi:GNAT superfamily N-acetyltransferase